MPYLPNEMFSVKSTQYISLKAYKKLYATSHWTYIAASAVTDTHTHTHTLTHKTTTVTLVHVPRLDEDTSITKRSDHLHREAYKPPTRWL